MRKKSVGKVLRQYLPDKRVLDQKPPFDGDIAQPLFHRGNSVGCITLHGIGGTPANIRVVADALIEKGYTVLSPTLPGHGETVRALNGSTGEAWLRCVEDAYDRLRDAGCTEIYALGLSLGGILSALLATERERPLSGLALFCAPIEVQPFLRLARRISCIIPFVRYPDEDGSQTNWQNNPYAQMYDGFSTRKLADLHRLCGRLRNSLSDITCPVLMVNAEYDDKVDDSSIDIWKRGATRVPRTEYVHLAHSPHGCTYGPERARTAALSVNFVERCVAHQF